MNIKKNIKIAGWITVFFAILLLNVQTASAVKIGGVKTDWKESKAEHGVIGGAVDWGADVAGGALKWAFGDISGGGELPTSFIDFQGGLQPPSGAGLAPELTKAKTAREFILNIINFALSFLGLIAVIIIIYGGFLYVTAAGNEEQSGKGKKTLVYAVIGILIILGSFALVNTLIRSAPVGGEDRGEVANVDQGLNRGSAPNIGGANLSQDRIYNLAALEIRASAERFANAYQLYANINSGIQDIRNAEPPMNGTEAKRLLREIQSFLKTVTSRTDPLTHTHRAAKRFLNDFVERYLELTGDAIEEQFTFIPVAKAQGGFIGNALENAAEAFAPFNPATFKEKLTAALDKSLLEIANQFDFTQIINKLILPKEVASDEQANADARLRLLFDGDLEKLAELLGDQIVQTLDPGTLILLKEALGPIVEARPEEVINKQITTPEDLQRALENIPLTFTIGDAFEEAKNSLTNAKRALIQTPDSVDHVVKVIKDLHRLYIVVRDIKFVAVRINASKTEGNAPLAVQFDSLGSIDPSGKTINDEDAPRHFWDLNGNGNFEDKLDDRDFTCEELHTTTVTCVYKRPGTYRVSLQVKSSEQQFATGIAYMTVIVRPPASRIHLEAQSGDSAEVLQGYDEAGRRIIDKSSFRITTEEGKTGVTFDASKSTDSGGVPSGLVNFEWSFGDGTDQIRGPEAKRVERHTYGAIGMYPLTLEVTDRGGVKDRKIVNVIVSSIAARINAASFRGDLNTPFEFDGSRSKSDVGQIESYEWKIKDEGGNELDDVTNNTSDTLRYKFKNPGKYSVELTVTDKIGNADTAHVDVLIESQAPKAIIDVNGCFDENAPCFNPSQPSLVKFSARKSFDPDEGDELRYRWEITGETENIDYEVIDGDLGADGEGDAEVTIKFLKIGEHTMRLTVFDQHRDSEIRRSATMEKRFEIISTVDLAWDEAMQTAVKLQDGKAEFTFKADSKRADTFSLEDDAGKEIANEEDVGANGKIEVKNTYTEAGKRTIELTAASEEHGSTVIKKRIYVAGGDEPLPVITMRKDDVEIFVNEDEPIEVLRNEALEFDASESLDSEGGKNLKISWSFGDGTSSDKAKAKHPYDNMSPRDPGYYEVKLTISDDDAVIEEPKTAEATVRIKVVSAKPTVQALTVRRKSDRTETPIDVEVTAEKPFDPDGSVREYKFWYFNPDNPEIKLGVVRKEGKENNHAELTVETYGESGDEKHYLFCIEVKDDENNVVTCDELFDEDTLPFLDVVNGPNQVPSADFTVNRSLVKVGDSVQFTAEATDPDGRIVEYIWDIEGDGFHNNAPSQLSQITHTYNSVSPDDGFMAQLKVVDDKGGIGLSDQKPVHVQTAFEPPIADFEWSPAGSGTTIRFRNTSRPAPGSEARITGYKWDFGLDHEFFCNTNPEQCNDDTTDDIDSTVQNPTFEYPGPDTYKVRLIVEDSNGQTADVITADRSRPQEPKDVEVIRDQSSEDAPIEAVLRTTPGPDKDGIVRLGENGEDVTFSFGDSRGDIKEYRIDYNIYYDTGKEASDDWDNCNPESARPFDPEGADGCRDNDSDFRTTDGSVRHRARYLRTFETHHPECLMTAKLTVIGENAEGNTVRSVDTVDLAFDIPPAMPNCFRTRGSAANLGAANLSDKISMNTAILFGLIGGAILALIGYWGSVIARKGKPRELGN